MPAATPVATSIMDQHLARKAALGLVLPAVGAVLHACVRIALQIMMGESVSVKADIYSFGVTLHEIITGEPPQRGRLRQIW